VSAVPSPARPAERGRERARALRGRVARIHGPRTLRLTEEDAPRPGPGEILVRIEGCGVCASGNPLWEGRPWFPYPTAAGVPGHESWGRIAALGEGVTRLDVGDRVATLAEAAFADYAVSPGAGAVRVPESLKLAPAEALGCAFNAVERAGLQPGERVAVVGIGFLGALLARLAVNAGAEVTAVSRRPEGRGQALAYGVAAAATPEEAEPSDGAFAVVFEATGVQAPLDLAGRLVAERGRLVVAGYHQDGPRRVDLQLWNWRGIDVINAHERSVAARRAGMAAAIDAVARGVLDPSPLYTHVYPLDRLGEALDAARERPLGFFKALVRM
jgi:2-desacetyl-2-hydroxyethyl bacteriochlorophyllide A dehydrogenase